VDPRFVELMLPVTQELELVRSGAGPIEEVEEKERRPLGDDRPQSDGLAGSGVDGDVGNRLPGREHARTLTGQPLTTKQASWDERATRTVRSR
jgi:hypothetical protein